MTQPPVFLAGDWHGNTNWANGRLASIGEKHPDGAVVLHVGDFGIWPDREGQNYLDSISTMCVRYKINIIVTPGNHEDWQTLLAMWADDRYDIREGIKILEPADRFWLHGRSFVSLGGAPSIDRHMRTEGVDWWPEEMITETDLQQVIDDGPTDVLLTHDSPDAPYWTSTVERICVNPINQWPLASLAYAAEGRRLISRALEAVKPRLHVHGHYHELGHRQLTLPGADHRTEIWGLPRDGDRFNVMRLNFDDGDLFLT